MKTITANELKTKGVSVVENALKSNGEAIITVRGERKYAIMDMVQYSKLREYELEVALLEAKADIEEDRVISESVEAHMERVTGK